MSEKIEKCAYCRKERPSSEMMDFTIHYRTRDSYNRAIVARKTNRYCRDKRCGGYDQMAHEG